MENWVKQRLAEIAREREPIPLTKGLLKAVPELKPEPLFVVESPRERFYRRMRSTGAWEALGFVKRLYPWRLLERSVAARQGV